jgi:hypothetical protein
MDDPLKLVVSQKKRKILLKTLEQLAFALFKRRKV